VQVACPEGRTCVAHARSTIRSTGEERVTLNQRLLATAGGTTLYSNNEGTQECTAADDSVPIPSGASALVQCNGVHATKAQAAGVECSLDLEFVEEG
jgi:hypothetical protein